MRFAQRTAWNTEETDLARAHRARLEAGLPLADLTASNPTRCGFHYPPEVLAALDNPAALDYDPNPRGLLLARQAVCAYYADHGAAVSPEQIILTTSTSEAYSFLFRLLCDPGDEILVPQPGYPLFDFLAALDDVRLKPAPLVYDHGWQIDPEGFRRAITPATRAIVLVHPNNPTGHFTKAWEGAELAAMCREHGLALIVDEVFLDYPSPAVPHPALSPMGGKIEAGHAPIPTFVSGLKDVPIFVVSGLSKIAGLPQMKAAWIVAAGPGPQRGAALDRLEVIADTFLSMNAPVQWALPAWLSGRHGIQRQILERVSANLAELDRQLAAHSALGRLHHEGGWYAVLRIPALRPDEETVRDLLDCGVWVHPGYFFGLPDSGWLVLSLLAPVDEFQTGMEALINFLGTNQEPNKFKG
ncbi:MAG: pyridoxal phosphate-dependent aminotransferase [Terracidiphilus sp.]